MTQKLHRRKRSKFKDCLLHLKGKVFSGKGEGSRFIRFPWVRKQIAEKLGLIPYLGTLNIKLDEESLALRNFLKKARGIEISPATGFCRGRCFRARLKGNLECAVVFPEIENYPEDIIEVVASVNLRERLQLKDGDSIEIKIVL